MLGGKYEHTPERRAQQVAAVFEGLLRVQGELATDAPQDLAEVHAITAASMVETGKLVEMDRATGTGGAAESDSVLGSRWQSYALAMLAVERAVDRQNPDAQPLLSEELRSAARNTYGEDLDRYMPALNVLAFVDPNQEQ